MTPVLAGLAVLFAAGALRGAVAARPQGRALTRVRLLVAVGQQAPGRRCAVPAPRSLEGRLAAAGIDVPVATVWHGWLAGGALLVIAGLAAGGPAAAALGAVLAAGGPWAVLATLHERADRLLEAALPEALEAVARSLRGGASVPTAVSEAGERLSGPLGGDLRAVAAAVAAGGRLEAALDGWAAARPLAGVRLAVAALAVGAGTGGAPARAVDGVAATLRARLAVAGEVRALSSQARASAAVIALAPVAFMVLAAASDTRTALFLFRSPAGLACLAAGVLLDGAGALWMHRLAAIDPW